MSLRTKYACYRKISLFLVFVMLFNLLYPPTASALTTGPSQPEFQHFEPATTTDMVDLFSGDFNYNIPLFELPGPNGGYPLNLAYHAGVTMDQEASWVGLGWDLNVGAMNRSMRGIPDEFSGGHVAKPDFITKREDMKPNITVGLGFTGGIEIVSIEMNLTPGVTAFYNNYKGVGYSISVDIVPPLFTIDQASGIGVGMNVSMNTQEGVDMGLNLTLSDAQKGNNSSFELKVGPNFNSIEGYRGIGMQCEFKKDKKIDGGKDGSKTLHGKFNTSHTFGTFSSPSISPSVNSEMWGTSIDISFKPGGELFGVFANATFNGFFKMESHKKRNTPVKYPVYGYTTMHQRDQHNSSDLNSLIDFNREKDNSLNKYVKSLPIPNYTYDIWSVTGQGIGQMVRPYKSHVGFVSDPNRMNKIGSGDFNLDIGGGSVIKAGGGGGIDVSLTRSGYWGRDTPGNEFVEKYGEQKSSNNSTYEPYYYKSHGDIYAMDPEDFFAYAGKFEPMAPFMNPIMDGDMKVLENKFKTKSGVKIDIKQFKEERTPRANTVLDIKNEVFKSNSDVLKEFTVKYATTSNTFSYNTTLSRSSDPDHHIAGFIATSTDGMRYNYALPAKNLKQVETSFSVKRTGLNDCSTKTGIPYDGNQIKYKQSQTNNHFSETSIPPYPHAFLLTSVLGPDYVDVTNDGVTDDDLGYWVKFNYFKAPTFNWRIPFNGANYSPGMRSTVRDDVGSFINGERENWYIQSIETKTNVAKFTLEARNDNRSATGDRSGTTGSSGTQATYKLNKIELFTRHELTKTTPVAIKTILLDYTNELCEGIDNGLTGKLTLKKVQFQFRNNSRSLHQSYEFDYNAENDAENKDYNAYAQDCWGNYKPNGMLCNTLHPYVKQDDANHDQYASMWSLKTIKLPSGAEINIDYESDDYSHVQNKPAMELYQIVGTDQAGSEFLDGNKIYFELREPINNDANATKKLQEYFDNSGVVYFKALVSLLKQGSVKENVSGYADVESFDFDATSIVSGKYTKAYVQLKPIKLKGALLTDHPIKVAAWNTLQLSRPDLIGTPSGAFPDSDNPTKEEKRAMILALLNPFKGLGPFINGFYNTCRNRNYGKEMNLTHSFVRLNSNNERTIVEGSTSRTIENFKYGGGHRVKRISIKENPTGATVTPFADNEFGVTYDYTTFENGKWTSSGVATYEPMVGGEENALKLPLPYEVTFKVKTGYKLYSEMPFNESLYPGASVGYRRVTVKSLVTDNVIKQQSGYAEVPSTGVTVHSFYTAKDFPVVTAFTQLNSFFSRKPQSAYAVLFVYSLDWYYGTQGYVIELNDMHGKPKSVETYRMSKSGAVVYSKPISGTYYDYKSQKISGVNGYDALQLVNDVKVIRPNGEVKDKIMGVDYELINDLRQSQTRTAGGGVDVNVDFVWPFPPVTFPLVLPRGQLLENRVKTAVCNKVIYRNGILERVRQDVDGSVVETFTKYFDEFTGQPLVQVVNNEYDKELTNIIHPAYWEYAGMGPGYENLGISFSAFFQDMEPLPGSTGEEYAKFKLHTGSEIQLNSGDEMAVTIGSHKTKGILMRRSGDDIWVDLTENPTIIELPGHTDFYVYRSGKRNQLNAQVGNITLLKP